MNCDMHILTTSLSMAVGLFTSSQYDIPCTERVSFSRSSVRTIFSGAKMFAFCPALRVDVLASTEIFPHASLNMFTTNELSVYLMRLRIMASVGMSMGKVYVFQWADARF